MPPQRDLLAVAPLRVIYLGTNALGCPIYTNVVKHFIETNCPEAKTQAVWTWAASTHNNVEWDIFAVPEQLLIARLPSFQLAFTNSITNAVFLRVVEHTGVSYFGSPDARSVAVNIKLE